MERADEIKKFNRQLGLKMSYCRISNNFTQTQLSSLLGIERSRLSHYEAGKAAPHFPFLVKFSDFFVVCIDHLVDCNVTIDDLSYIYPASHFSQFMNKKQQ